MATNRARTLPTLALDFATKTGWAHSCGASGVWDFSIKKDESSGMRLIRFQAKLRETHESVGFGLIVFETVSVGRGTKANMDGVKLQSKLQGVIEQFAEEHDGVECCSYHQATIKKHALPRVKKRDKAAMLSAARARWPAVDIIDDNQADALWLLDLAQHDLGLREK